METLIGRCISVDTLADGDTLAQGSLAGQTTIYVNDVSPFATETDSGTVSIGETEYDYFFVDEEMDSLSLSSPLTEDVEEGEFVFRLPVQHQRVATVAFEDGDPIEARVPHFLYPMLPEGMRDDVEAETVEIVKASSGYVVFDVNYRTPLIQGELLDPNSTIPEKALTDGLAPEVSPTPELTPGVGFLVVKLPEIANRDLTKVAIYVSATSPVDTTFEPSAIVLNGSSVMVNRTTTGDRLVAGTTYYVRTVASDADGSAPSSDEASASPIVIDPSEVDAEILDAIAAADDRAGQAQQRAQQALDDALAALTKASEAAADAASKGRIIRSDTEPPVEPGSMWVDGTGQVHIVEPGIELDHTALTVTTAPAAQIVPDGGYSGGPSINAIHQTTAGSFYYLRTPRLPELEGDYAIEAMAYMPSTASSPRIAGVVLGGLSGSNGYVSIADLRNGDPAATPSNATLQIRRNGASTTAASDRTTSLAMNTWYRIRSERVGGQVRSYVYDTEGNLLNQATTPDDLTGTSAYHNAGIAVYGVSGSKVSDVKITTSARWVATVDERVIEAIDQAQQTADSKASPADVAAARQQAIDAAQADATTKANAARTAAEQAAAADATAKAAQAKAEALTGAATDAQAKATAAASAAELAAKQYADAQASGASEDALNAARTYAEQQASAAQAAAESAAAADATAKANQAKADAASDASAKASAAQAAAEAKAEEARVAATQAQSTADSKNKTFTQNTAPTGSLVVGDLWYDTASNNRVKRWSGTAWVDVRDTGIAAAQNAANAKGEVIFSSTEPASAKRLAQNLWIDTAGGANTPKRWTGSAWVAVTDKATIDAAAAAVAAQQAAQDAAAIATQAQTTANGKNTVTYGPASAGAPTTTNRKDGDLHFGRGTGDTLTSTVKFWRFVGGAWVEETLNGAVLSNLDAGSITAGFLDVANRIAAGAIVTEKLAAGSVTTPILAAGSVSAEKVAADVMVTNEVFSREGMVVGEAGGAQVSITRENGFYQTNADGSRRTQFGTKPNEPNYMDTELTARGLNSLEGATLHSKKNLIPAGASLGLAAGVESPTRAPRVTQGWATDTKLTGLYDASRSKGVSEDASGNFIFARTETYQVSASPVVTGTRLVIDTVNKDTGAVTTKTSTEGVPMWAKAGNTVFSGVNYYVSISVGNSFRIQRRDSNLNLLSEVTVDDDGPRIITLVSSLIYYAARGPLVGGNVYRTVLRRREVSATMAVYGTDIGLGNHNSTVANALDMQPVFFAGPGRYVHIHYQGANGELAYGREYDTSGNQIANTFFYGPNNSIMRGAYYLDAASLAVKAVGDNLTIYTSGTSRFAQGNVEIGYAYSNTSSGYVTAMSPTTIVPSVGARQILFVQVDAYPEGPASPNTPNQIVIYASSSVLGQPMDAQATIAGSTATSVALNAVAYDSAFPVPPPTVNTFPGADAALLYTANPDTRVYGDGQITARDPQMPTDAANKRYVDAVGARVVSLEAPPYIECLGSTTSLPAATYTSINYTTTVTSRAISRSGVNFTIQKAGKYLITATVQVNDNGDHYLGFFVNGSQQTRARAGGTALSSGVNDTAVMELAIGDVVTIRAYRSSGSSSLGGGVGNKMSILKVSD